MGNSKSKKAQKEPDNFFMRERWKEQKRDEKRKKNVNPVHKRQGAKEPAVTPAALLVHTPSSTSGPAPIPKHVRAYDVEALDRMRFQLHNDSDAFLLNNILLSVQFFENYEREVQNIKNNPISERDHLIDAAMVRHHKHVFFADRMQEAVHERVRYQRNKGQLEPLASPRLFIIYDNVEASEPGDTSDYSAVLDAPFYKLCIEDCKESGYVKLKKIEVLESTLTKDCELDDTHGRISDDSVYTDSEKESNDSDDCAYVSKGEALLHKIKNKLNQSQEEHYNKNNEFKINEPVDIEGRRSSGPVKQVSSQAQKSQITNIDTFRKINSTFAEDSNEMEVKPRKSILKNAKRLSGIAKEFKSKSNYAQKNNIYVENQTAEDTETSGYRSNSSGRQTESSETESDYGYSTITESTTPKKVQLSLHSSGILSSGVLSDECWDTLHVKLIDNWSDDEDEEMNDTASKVSLTRNLYETHHYLNSMSFMANFVDLFMVKLGSGIGLTQDAITNALTQGASIYCDTAKNGIKNSYEVYPALLAAWPNAANPWIIRERRIIQNPRTNFSYQWPTKYMVNKAIGFGCLLVPLGFRPKRGVNPDQKLQWRIIFPAAERYLESCLAHSHVRCYMFALALHKTFMENEMSKIGIDASHIKNQLFWQCEDNYAKWPEDRLGETLRLFLRSFYSHFGQNRFPNYFIESCNDFKSIPKPLLLKLQRRLADILEAPVLHVLNAVEKLKYTKKDFYPALNCHRLYEILTCKNPLRIINPNIPASIPNNYSSESDDEPDVQTNFWDKAKAQDKHYQWKKERQRQIQERKKAVLYNKKQKNAAKQDIEIKTTMLPKKMEAERRRLVLEFFIPHFIAMARNSEKFEAISQAVIYLEQAQRLCMLLIEEPAGDTTANDYLDVIRDKLTDCQRKLADQSGYKLPPRRESHADRSPHGFQTRRKQRPRYEHIMSQDSPTDMPGISAFTFVDVHTENSPRRDTVKLANMSVDEESKL